MAPWKCSICVTVSKLGSGLVVFFLLQNQEMKGIRPISLNSEDIFATPVLAQSQFPDSRLFCGKRSVKLSK